MTGKRESVIRFRVTESEQKEIESRAVGNVSSWLRDLALDQPLKRKPKPINPKLLYELNKIGVNLNQLAKFCNLQTNITAQEKMDLIFIFRSIDEELKALREKYDS